MFIIDITMRVIDMTVEEIIRQGGDLLKLLRQLTPEEGRQMVIAIYAEGAAAMEQAMRNTA